MINIPHIVIAVSRVIGETSVQHAAQRIVLERFVTEITVDVHRTALRDFMVTNVIRIAVITVLQRNVIDKVEPALLAVQETGKGIGVRVCTVVRLFIPKRLNEYRYRSKESFFEYIIIFKE